MLGVARQLAAQRVHRQKTGAWCSAKLQRNKICRRLLSVTIEPPSA